MTAFGEITILVVIATLVAFFMRLLRQPLVIGYIITGLIGGPLLLDIIKSEEILGLFSEIGIAFLLFIVGLNLTPQAIKTFGKVSLITGIGQVVFTFSIGWFIAAALGAAPVAATYLAVALAFSSTIIILKLLSDKGDLDKLYGKISIGFLLVQDLIAILILFLVPLVSSPENTTAAIALNIGRGLAILVLVYLVSYFLFPSLNRFVARSQELLFLFAISWGLGLAGLFRTLGFSLESGALIAGATLSILPSHDEIHSRLKPLRDFFIILFFILLGARMVLTDVSALLGPAVVLSLFVLAGNPLILMIIMGILGYRKRTSFQTGLTVAQISEFSLIVIAMGVRYNHVSEEILSLATLVGLITIFASTYMITYSDRLYEFLSPALSMFERKKPRETAIAQELSELILFGHNRIGYDFLKVFRSMKKPFLLVDYDPRVIDIMSRQKVPCVYGDASDLEFLRLLNFKQAKIIVSTIPDYETNKLILRHIRSKRKSAIMVAVAHSIAESKGLYRLGADYVIMPHFLGGEQAASLVKNYGFNRLRFVRLKARHLRHLAKRAEMGHDA